MSDCFLTNIYYMNMNVEICTQNMKIDNMTIFKEKMFTNDPKIIFVMPMSKIILNMKQTKCRKVFQLDLW